ncbi:calmodulin-binding protein Sha1 [Aspergillus nomiae NRRL 13137]|uniref:Calmodulin-binding protein Sha1 n=1 Tax=Aspergillus nomiae NRRL (strain ATCC 15546 / NRRL 13137 / CBS 260.88 / M93) TaxID=1509407 RepID=A0A0L1ILV1_ASPN3|nr:calmodulin-binding protein Sha1 [Aspergillus nomiae NRRL 13137]KNG80581.1 calmodulin-binding protein Sha1 [Aspergillus nomiae NRRL 13137]
MSGLLGEFGTPCPSRSSRFDRSSGGDSSFSKLWEDSLENCDETVNIEFTTEIKAPLLTAVKPRRRTKTGSSFAIHDEGEQNIIQTANPKRRETRPAVAPSGRKMSLLAQPAQRFRPKVSFTASPPRNLKSLGEPEKKLRSTKLDTQKNRELLMQINGNGRQTPSKSALKTDVRRNTVYIPQDDTTVASMFMGILSPSKSTNVQDCVSEDTQVNTLESQIARKRQAKRSLASSAQRVPLQPSTKVKQESCIHVDIAGKNGGKENVPPGTVFLGKGKGKVSQPVKINNELENPRQASNPAQTQPCGYPSTKPTSPLAARSVNGTVKRTVMRESRNNVKAPSVQVARESNKVEMRRATVNRTPSVSRNLTFPNTLRNSEMRVNHSKTSVVRPKPKHIDDEYPLVKEDIINPAMYEDDWLSHQEIMITQLANRLFDQTNERSSFKDPTVLRHALLKLYQNTSFAHLYKRVQASLLYGAMSIPKDVLVRNDRLQQDVGMKRKFLDFWMQTYDPRALRAAVETITGRRMTDSKLAQESSHSHLEMDSGNEKALKRGLENFLNTICCKTKTWRDMLEYSAAVIQTSIMIVILLDKGMASSGTVLPPCLFLRSSQFKSSAAVLQALARFLLPSSGDIIKTLGHLDCQLVYEQNALQEYDYQISNLAVDMRDGVRLTRIVELLLYPTNVCLADGERLGPLSHGLKLPCLSRTVKLFNVRIALDALAGSKSSYKLVRRIRAEDIVDGHRERTIALLWGLISQWSLAELVDWGDLRKEIDRLKQKAISRYGHESVKDEGWFNRDYDGLCEQSSDATLLLRQWASILGYLKGLHLENFSTSFADGKIYESIVDEYESYILKGDQPSSTELKEPLSSLQSRLRALGCSAQLAYLISPGSSRSHILDSDFTLGALTFLCSRFLSATKRARAATVLQKRWRRVLAHRDLQRRTVARDVARQCAAVVQTRDRILWAKEIIIQWWRMVKAQQQRHNGTDSQYEKQTSRSKGVPLRGQQSPY